MSQDSVSDLFNPYMNFSFPDPLLSSPSGSDSLSDSDPLSPSSHDYDAEISLQSLPSDHIFTPLPPLNIFDHIPIKQEVHMQGVTGLLSPSFPAPPCNINPNLNLAVIPGTPFPPPMNNFSSEILAQSQQQQRGIKRKHEATMEMPAQFHQSFATPDVSQIPEISQIPGAEMTTGTLQDLLQDADLKKKRLARKAELARLSRRKKKVRMCDLEQEVDMLRADLERVREENKKLQQEHAKAAASASASPVAPTSNNNDVAVVAPPKKKRKKNKEAPMVAADVSPEQCVQRALDSLLAFNAPASPEADIQLEQMVAELSQAFKIQGAASELYLRGLESAVAPALSMKFLDWSLSQKQKFYQDESGLFVSLFRDVMGASPEQLRLLLEFKDQYQAQQHIFATSQQTTSQDPMMDAFIKFETLFKQRGLLNQVECYGRFKEIFAPRQMAAYFKWVDQFGAICIKINI